jgi:hypothetical protein
MVGWLLMFMMSGLVLWLGCLDSPGVEDISGLQDPQLTFILDSTPPKIKMRSPQDGGVVSGLVSLSADAVDDVCIVSVEFFVDNNLTGRSTDYSAPFSYDWDTSTLTDVGIHSIFARATDTSRNVSFSDTVHVIVDNTGNVSTAVILNDDFTSRQVFPSDNWWNLDISQAPIDPNSQNYISWIGEDVRLHPDFGPSPYGIPYVSVSKWQELVPVNFYAYADESDVGSPAGLPGYPIPDQAYESPGFIEGDEAGGGDSGDRHLIVVDRDNWILYETFGTKWNSDMQLWEAACGAVFDLNSNDRRPEGWTSTDAAGLAVFPGLVKYDEVYGTGEIRHALRFTIQAADGYVWPASHAGTETPGAPPLGMRLRLKASFDTSGYPLEMQKIMKALKKYGLILADNGSNMFVQGTMDNRWNSQVLNNAFHSLTAGDFEVIELGWDQIVSGISY